MKNLKRSEGANTLMDSPIEVSNRLTSYLNSSCFIETPPTVKTSIVYLNTWRVVIFRQYPLLTGGPKPGFGRLASIGSEVDYHTALYNLLEQSMNYLEGFLGKQPRDFYVDKDGGDDRAWAVASGEGGMGKNHLFIHSEMGSAINIGSATLHISEQVFKVWMEQLPSPVTAYLCGSCTLCVKACPTGALEEGQALKRSVCRSAINQKKGLLNEQESSLLDDFVYGCDICLIACPYNRENLSEEGLYLATDCLDEISNKTFNERYGHRSFAYMGRTRIKRNLDFVKKIQEKKK